MNIVNFDLGEGIIEANVGSWPITLPDVDNPVNIIFRSFYFEIVPHFSDRHHVIDVGSIKPILIFNLKHYYTALGMLWTP